jgi:hypothetical protein
MSALMTHFLLNWIKEVYMLIAALDWYCRHVHGQSLHYAWLGSSKRQWKLICDSLARGRGAIDGMWEHASGKWWFYEWMAQQLDLGV